MNVYFKKETIYWKTNELEIVTHNSYDLDYRSGQSLTLFNQIDDYDDVDLVLVNIKFKISDMETVYLNVSDVFGIDSFGLIKYLRIIAEMGGISIIILIIGVILTEPFAKFAY